ncbi:MAG: alpha/beta fold hydrolase [Ideonella sp.]|nr:alpha/beta fold hydrolase [Ideonella sp.]MCC7458482.1 alpha/beta fold hydrolase [Nitrospira sp.]
MLTLLALAVVLYGLMLALLWWGQERLLFLPTRLAPQHRMALERDVHERWIDVPGARLHALHLRLPAPRGVVFFLHGNAGNLESWFTGLALYRQANFDLFMIDYRGYGKSSGRIGSEAQLHADVQAAWDAVAPAYAGRPRVIFGRSLGTGLAVPLALRVDPSLTILVSAYASMRALAAEHYRWVPSALLRYPLATDAAVPRLRGPLLLVHGERDEIIGVHHAQALQQAQPRAQLHIVHGAGHNDLDAFPEYEAVLRRALDALVPPGIP